MTKQLVNDGYFKQIISIVDEIYPEDVEQPSIYRDTTLFFVNDATSTREQLDIKIQIAALQDELAEGDNPAASDQLEALIDKLEQAKQKDTQGKELRLQRVRSVCSKVFALCEGDSDTSTQKKTAKFLAALWLLAEQHEGNLKRLNQRLKVPYKLALTLRFADIIIANNLPKVTHWSGFTNPKLRYQGPTENKQKWFDAVAMPMMMASLFQDSGLQHPLSIKLLYGDNGREDPFRVLSQQERQSLLKMNYRFSVDYVTLGLGMNYASDSPQTDQQALAQTTTLELVKDAYKPKSGIGEILKIPQIYTSIVFSTKSGFRREDVPKGCLLIEQLAKEGVLNSKLVRAFNAITGLFPQGFGLLNSEHKLLVYGLNPQKPHEPYVKPLLDTSDIELVQPPFTLLKKDNFYFASTRKQFDAVDSAKIEALVKVKQQDNASTWQSSKSFAKWHRLWANL
jgi:hypothetical protein